MFETKTCLLIKKMSLTASTVQSYAVCFDCLEFFVPVENVSLVTSAGEGLHFLTYARHLWSFSSEGFF